MLHSLGSGGPIAGYRPNRRKRKRSPIVWILLFGCLIAGGWWLFSGSDGDLPNDPDPANFQKPAGPDWDSLVVTELPPLGSDEPFGPVAPADLPRAVTGEIGTSLYGSFAEHFDPDDKAAQLQSQQLAAHFKRLFFFDVDFRRDLRPGDRFAFLWTPSEDSSDGVRILAAMFESKLHGKRFDAYYFEDAEDDFSRHYTSDGLESQRRLLNPPLKNFEQVTSLLNDRRPRHHGIDFKGPVGTTVTTPFDAEVIGLSRKIQRYNGRWVKLRYHAKNLDAIYLHLDSVAEGLSVGKRIKAGAVLGTLGNTGRSYAPHLHYQIQHYDGRIVNPYDVHGATRRKISAQSRAAFMRRLGEYRALLPELASAPAAPDETATR